MSKRNGLALFPLALVGLALAAVRGVKKKRTSLSILGWVIFLGGVGLISAWWSKVLLKRWYHWDIKFIASLLSHPSNSKELHWDALPHALRYTFETFWACFGWGTIGVEGWVYKLVAVVYLLAGLGLVILLIKGSNRLAKLGMVVLMLHLLIVLSAPTYRMLRGSRSIPLHGRYVLPAIPAVSLLLFLGLASLVPKKFVKVLAAFLGLAMFAYALLIPFRYIMPAYAKPELLSPNEVKTLEHSLGLRFGDKIKLIGYELDGEEIAPGEKLSVTLYWRCLREMEENYILAVKVLGQDYRVYGVLHLHPGRGNFPTSLWQKGDIFRETYQVPISSDVPAPSLAKIGVDFFVHGSDGGLDAFDADGRPSNATFGRLIIRSKERPKIENAVYYELGDKVALVGYKIDEVLDREESGVRVKLYWLALAEMDRDYTVFVHLLDEEYRIKFQGDSQPMGGNSPTSIWKAGEVIEDEHFIPLPLIVRFDLPGEGEGKRRVAVGMYDLATMERLVALDSKGARLPDDRIVLICTKCLPAGGEARR